MELAGKRILVVGLGRSGLAATELLTKRDAVVSVTDSKRPDELFHLQDKMLQWGVTLYTEQYAVRPGLDMVVLSPGVAVDAPLAVKARAMGIRVIGEVELASYFLQGRTIGITGTNGKTTSTAMLQHILKQAGERSQMGGNIGIPPTAMVASSQSDQWNVLELSSFQLETIENFHADIAACLNVTPDHLDRHHVWEAYVAAKRRLFETQESTDWAILNASDAICAGFAERIPARVTWFSTREIREPGFWLEGDSIQSSFGPLMKRADMAIPGLHNVENAMAAAACAYRAGVPLEEIAQGIAAFEGVEHRIEFTREVLGVKYYNDSKATNVDSTIKALESFERGVWIILGGKDKDSDYSVLRDLLRQKARAVLLIGSASAKIADQVGGSASLVRCGTLETAVTYAHRHALPGDVVLLAPACASFDQFESYEHRGRVFKELVHTLPAEIGAAK